MDLARKRREKEGHYDKEEVVKEFHDELDEVEEFVISIKYKDGAIGMRSSSSDSITVLGTLEQSKLIALAGEE